MEDTSVKKVTITGAAAGSLTPTGFEQATQGGASESKGKTRKRKEKIQVTANLVGAGTSPGPLIQLASTSAPGDELKAVGVASDLTVQGAQVGTISPAVGGSEPRVVLSKTKKKSKIILAAKPVVKQKDAPAKKKTIKKVKMSLKGLTRKLKKAHTIRSHATGTNIEEIKKNLVKMGLVKPDTTAPDDVLRQIYLDVETMKKRAL